MAERLPYNILGRRKFTGSFRMLIPFASPGTPVLTEDNHGRAYLRIKNVGASMVWVAFGQADAKSNGYPLDPNQEIIFQNPENAPDERVTATAETGDTEIAVIMVRYEQ